MATRFLEAVRALLRDERGDWPGYIVTILISVLGGAAILFGLLSSGRESGGDIAQDLEDLRTAGQLVTRNTTGLNVTTGQTGAAVNATGN